MAVNPLVGITTDGDWDFLNANVTISQTKVLEVVQRIFSMFNFNQCSFYCFFSNLSHREYPCAREIKK